MVPRKIGGLQCWTTRSISALKKKRTKNSGDSLTSLAVKDGQMAKIIPFPIDRRRAASLLKDKNTIQEEIEAAWGVSPVQREDYKIIIARYNEILRELADAMSTKNGPG